MKVITRKGELDWISLFKAYVAAVSSYWAGSREMANCFGDVFPLVVSQFLNDYRIVLRRGRR